MLRRTRQEAGMTCDHGDCRCSEILVERGEKKFCSEHCADQETLEHPEPSCRCGHPDCAA
ncbi:MAG TPA: hypothetical protein VEO02_03675 [Thermoanaerobaculia bacterium]|nr:hypothetical protein [Thermoanaerobaculia bacterium]